MIKRPYLNVLFAQRFSYPAMVLLLLLFVTVILTGCEKKSSHRKTQEQPPIYQITAPVSTELPVPETLTIETSEPEQCAKPTAPFINQVDYSSYFKERNGCAVFFTPSTNQYDIYNMSMSDLQRSPCSTFKIISSLLGLENNIIDKQNSVRAWSGESFWKPEWNQDIDFLSAFQSSCVWYFRQVIDELGNDAIRTGLADLDYGNQNISDWEGKQNTNNSNRALTGFWIESSLKISPKQQTEVMARIFEPSSLYSRHTIQQLKEAMHVTQTNLNYEIFGKTGSGKDNHIWVDAWFVGMIEREAGNIYFATYLGESDSHEISSKLAKEITIEIADDFYND